jgi:AcrR family transcriptional regulator
MARWESWDPHADMTTSASSPTVAIIFDAIRSRPRLLISGHSCQAFPPPVCSLARLVCLDGLIARHTTTPEKPASTTGCATVVVVASTSRSTRSVRPRRGRGSLSAEEILDAAQRLVELDGLHSLSMPRLAEQLGCGVTSIYWYFHSKDDLIVALAEQVGRELHLRLPPVPTGPWEERLIAYFEAFRELMQRSPVSREVFAYREQPLFLAPRVSRGMRRRIEEGLTILTGEGLTPKDAQAVYSTCTNYTIAFIVIESGDGGESDLLGALDHRQYPLLTALPDLDILLGVGDVQFRRGFELLLDGVRQEYPVLNRRQRRRTAAG